MKILSIGIITLFFQWCNAQTCGVQQNLTSLQASSIQQSLNELELALVAEDIHQIDSISTVLKALYATEGGLPESNETYVSLSSNSNLLDLNNAILLSRQLIDQNTAIYSNLWKVAKGMAPPSYLPNSIQLRYAADIAHGLYLIAFYETDVTRKNTYTAWANQTMDSLLTMQLPSGAFPFPDLRTYNDPVFSPIIQNFMNALGPDSILALQNGWIVDDFGTGEFKFDAGVISQAFFTAYNQTGQTNYLNAVSSISNFLLPYSFNSNYNYNTFSAHALYHSFVLEGNQNSIDRASQTLRYSVTPGQIDNGRWVDGHNAQSRYHSIILQHSLPVVSALSILDTNKTELETVFYKASKNMMEYTINCNASTGFRWTFPIYYAPFIANSLKDSLIPIIGQYIQTAASGGNYLDVPSMGEYLDFIYSYSMASLVQKNDSPIYIGPNPASDFLRVLYPSTHYSITNLHGEIVLERTFETNCNDFKIDLSMLKPGTYIVFLNNNGVIRTQRIVKQ